jgi:hypothetical protein
VAETLFKKRITSHSGRETEIVSFIGREGPRVRLAIFCQNDPQKLISSMKLDLRMAEEVLEALAAAIRAVENLVPITIETTANASPKNRSQGWPRRCGGKPMTGG